jgi:hypothetical protein
MDFGIGEMLALVSAGFSVMQGISSYNTGKQNEKNAKIEAKQELAVGQENATRQRRIVASQLAQQSADTGASGTTGIGSPMEVYLANAKQGELQAQDQLYQGKIGAYGKKKQADIYNRQASSSLVGGIAGAVSTLGSSGIFKPKPATP